MSALLEARSVSKSYPVGGVLSRHQTQAVSDVSFALGEDGPEIFTIIGESGSGKTTLSRMILGLEQPSSGEIAFMGRSVGHFDRAARLSFMAKVQPVFQNPFEAFNPLKPVDRYLRSAARRFRDLGSAAAIDAVLDQALQNVGLSLAEIRGRFPHELSGGQLQRAAIARALIPEPALLVADEPVSMVDASLRFNGLRARETILGFLAPQPVSPPSGDPSGVRDPTGAPKPSGRPHGRAKWRSMAGEAGLYRPVITRETRRGGSHRPLRGWPWALARGGIGRCQPAPRPASLRWRRRRLVLRSHRRWRGAGRPSRRGGGDARPAMTRSAWR
jgi:ABC-type dipeptide/oligopeptide/nickel transport system ATPase subunit